MHETIWNTLDCSRICRIFSSAVLQCYGDPKTLYERSQNEIDDGTHPEAPKGKDLSVEDIESRLKTYRFVFDVFYDEDKRIYLDSSVLSPKEMVAQVLEKLK